MAHGSAIAGGNASARGPEPRTMLRGAGVPLLENNNVSWFLGFLRFMEFRISKIDQDSTIVKFRFLFENARRSQLFWAQEKLRIIQTYSIVFKNNFDLTGFAYVLRSSTIIQGLLRFHHRKNLFFFENARRNLLFWTQEHHYFIPVPPRAFQRIDPEITKNTKHTK